MDKQLAQNEMVYHHDHQIRKNSSITVMPEVHCHRRSMLIVGTTLQIELNCCICSLLVENKESQIKCYLSLFDWW